MGGGKEEKEKKKQAIKPDNGLWRYVRIENVNHVHIAG